MVIKYTGHTDARCVDFIESVFESRVGSQGGLELYVDAEEQTGYDTAFRERIAAWVKRIRPQAHTRCILVCSRMVAFGVTVVNMLAGGDAVALTSRQAFTERIAIATRKSLADVLGVGTLDP